MATLQTVNDSNFQTEVLDATLPVLVDFYADWCGPCKALAPVIEKVAAAHQGKLKVVKLNTDDSPKAPQTYKVQGIPTLILFRGGQEADRAVGYLNEARLGEFVARHTS